MWTRAVLAAVFVAGWGGSAQDGPPSKDYKLVWSDEFNGDQLDPGCSSKSSG